MANYQYANAQDTTVQNLSDGAVFGTQAIGNPEWVAWQAAGGPAITAPFPTPQPTTTAAPTPPPTNPPFPSPPPIPPGTDTAQLSIYLFRLLARNGTISSVGHPPEYQALLP